MLRLTFKYKYAQPVQRLRVRSHGKKVGGSKKVRPTLDMFARMDGEHRNQFMYDRKVQTEQTKNIQKNSI